MRSGVHHRWEEPSTDQTGGVLGSCGLPTPGCSPVSGVWRGPFPFLAQAVVARQTWFSRPRPSRWDHAGAHLSAGKLGAVWGTRVDHGHWGASVLQQEAVRNAWWGARGEAGRGGHRASVTPSASLLPESLTSDSRKRPTLSLAISTSGWIPSPWWR